MENLVVEISQDFEVKILSKADSSHIDPFLNKNEKLTLFDIFPSELSERIRKAIANCTENSCSESLLFSYNNDDRNIHEGLVIPTANEKVLFVTKDIAESTDFTDALMASKEQAEKNEERYKGLINNADLGIVVHAPDTSIILSNSKAGQLLGLSNEEMRGKVARDPYWRFVDENEIEIPLNEYPVFKVLRKKKSIENQIIGVSLPNKPITWLTVNGFPVFNGKGEISEVIINFIDATVRKNFEKELILAKDLSNQSEFNLKQIQTLAKIGGWEFDLATELFTFNDNFYEIFKSSVKKVGGYKMSAQEYATRFVHPDDVEVVGVEIGKAVQTTDPNYSGYLEHRIIFDDGETGHIAVKYFIVKDPNGQTIKLYGFNQEITERKKLVQDLANAEKSDQLKTAFLHNISHEIRTPLNAICGFAEMLSDKDTTPEEKENYTKIIKNNSDQLLKIISDIVTVSSLETGQEVVNLKVVNVNHVIDELYEVFNKSSEQNNIELLSSKALPDSSSIVETDLTKLKQVLTNLLTNAFKFTKAGQIQFGYTLTNNQLEFFVKDSGIGIKKIYHDKIFKRFIQANNKIQSKYGGTGLGLSISKGYVNLLGGNIWVNSEYGNGATFYFTIPYKQAEIKANLEETIEHESTNIGSDLNEEIDMLVAEDQFLNFMLIERLLRNLPVRLLHASDGKIAVEMFKANPNIKMVLMDLKMPNMSGDEAAQIIKALNSEMIIVAQTGYALEDEKKKYEGIFDDYITKPIQTGAFLKKMKGYIESSSLKEN